MFWKNFKNEIEIVFFFGVYGLRGKIDIKLVILVLRVDKGGVGIVVAYVIEGFN